MNYDRLTEPFRKRRKKSRATRAVEQVRDSARDALSQLRNAGNDFRIPRPELSDLKLSRPRSRASQPDERPIPRREAKRRAPLVIRVGRGVRVRVVVPGAYAEEVSDRRG